MKRQYVNGSWFDVDRATAYQETSSFDGSNWISGATGSQWEHEILYRSSGGAWALNRWSQYEGTADRWRILSAADAYSWLIAHEHWDAVPPEVLAAREV